RTYRSHDSVHCAVCGSTYHMNCVRPPLLKKPSRGFAWACAPCNRAQEKKLEARNMTHPIASTDTNEEDNWDDEDEEMSPAPNLTSGGNTLDGGGGANTPTSIKSQALEEKQPTAEQLAMAKQWP